MSGPRLAGVRAIVTGASRGLGRAIAERFAAEGCRLVVTATTGERAAGVAERIAGAGGEVHGVGLDLGDRGSVTAAAREAVAVLGRVDVLVANAGILGVLGPLEDVPADVWDEVIAVDLTGTVALVQGVLPAMADGGAIVAVSSGAAGRAGWGPYAVAKLAVDGVVRMLREELAPRGIRCVSVNPGRLRTEMRAAAYPGEDPATLPRPSSVVEPFVAIAEGADPGPRIDASEWGGA